jgi:hypothetical protein
MVALPDVLVLVDERCGRCWEAGANLSAYNPAFDVGFLCYGKCVINRMFAYCPPYNISWGFWLMPP